MAIYEIIRSMHSQGKILFQMNEIEGEEGTTASQTKIFLVVSNST